MTTQIAMVIINNNTNDKIEEPPAEEMRAVKDGAIKKGTPCPSSEDLVSVVEEENKFKKVNCPECGKELPAHSLKLHRLVFH